MKGGKDAALGGARAGEQDKVTLAPATFITKWVDCLEEAEGGFSLLQTLRRTFFFFLFSSFFSFFFFFLLHFCTFLVVFVCFLICGHYLSPATYSERLILWGPSSGTPFVIVVFDTVMSAIFYN